MSNQLKTILYVEDETDIRDIAQIALEELGGFKVIYCKNGRDALEQAPGIQPDLLLLDVMMPEMDGPTTLQELRKLENYRDVPAIFMTAKIQAEEIIKYKKMGAIDVITKPFDPMTLADKIKAIWSKHYEASLETK